jgi:hypothetical protein
VGSIPNARYRLITASLDASEATRTRLFQLRVPRLHKACFGEELHNKFVSFAQ